MFKNKKIINNLAEKIVSLEDRIFELECYKEEHEKKENLEELIRGGTFELFLHKYGYLKWKSLYFTPNENTIYPMTGSHGILNLTTSFIINETYKSYEIEFRRLSPDDYREDTMYVLESITPKGK